MNPEPNSALMYESNETKNHLSRESTEARWVWASASSCILSNLRRRAQLELARGQEGERLGPVGHTGDLRKEDRSSEGGCVINGLGQKATYCSLTQSRSPLSSSWPPCLLENSCLALSPGCCFPGNQGHRPLWTLRPHPASLPRGGAFPAAW